MWSGLSLAIRISAQIEFTEGKNHGLSLLTLAAAP